MEAPLVLTFSMVTMLMEAVDVTRLMSNRKEKVPVINNRLHGPSVFLHAFLTLSIRNGALPYAGLRM